MSRIAIVRGLPRHMGGYLRDKPDHRDYFISAPSDIPLPKATDLSNPAAVAVRDQLSIGSCVANTDAAMYGYVAVRNGVSDPQLSRLWLYSKTRKEEGIPLTEDSGLQPRDALSVLAKYGCPLEQSYGYDIGKLTVDPPDLADEAARHKALFYYRCPNLWTVMASLAQGFVVGIGFAVPDNMQSDQCAATGDIQMPAPSEGFDGGHEVLVTGYDMNTKRVKFQNSWGADWGKGGFGTLPFDMFDQGLVSDAWTLRSELL